MVSRQRPKKRQSTVVGVYVGHSRGFGFFVPENGGDDRFVPPGREGQAIDGDTVEAEPGGGDTVRLTRVLARGRQRLVGTYLGDGRFLADAHHIGKPLPADGDAKRGDKVVVAASLQGFQIARILGRSGAPDVEDAAVLAELDIEAAFPDEVKTEVARLQPPGGDDLRDRLDLRNTPTVVTIDPLTSRDFDDAISLERRAGEWHLGVHIADVSHYVRPGTALDLEARRRGTSVYLPGQVIPMLPERLSNDLCSLREGQDRLALSVLMRFNSDGQLLGTRFARTVIRPYRRFSYERASRVMDGSRRESGRVGTVLCDMLALTRLLNKARRSLDFPRGDSELVFDGAGNVVDVRSIAKDVAHGVVEELMLAANQQVAHLMLSRSIPVLYRHHPAPEDLTHVWETLELLGVEQASRMGLRRAIRKASKMGFGPTVTSAVFRCMPRARYTSEKASHFSLAFDAYLHFTSPIRRYSDLTVHRELHTLLAGRSRALTLKPGGDLGSPRMDDQVEALGLEVNAHSAAAERAESRMRRRRVLAFLLRQGAIPTTGQVTGVVEKGLFVDLMEYGTSGFINLDELPKDTYQLKSGRLQGERHNFCLGQELEVTIHRIDPAAGQLDLRPVF